jgi:hypothetical protein
MSRLHENGTVVDAQWSGRPRLARETWSKKKHIQEFIKINTTIFRINSEM